MMETQAIQEIVNEEELPLEVQDTINSDHSFSNTKDTINSDHSFSNTKDTITSDHSFSNTKGLFPRKVDTRGYIYLYFNGRKERFEDTKRVIGIRK